MFTKRTHKVKDHKGQISFPGGTYEEADQTLLNTALRECAEETGLKAESIDVLGELDDENTVTSDYTITPFVGLIPWPYQLKLNEDEVAEVIEIPVSALMNQKCRKQVTEILNGKVIDSYEYHYQGNVIWGATARIVKQFLDIFAGALPER